MVHRTLYSPVDPLEIIRDGIDALGYAIANDKVLANPQPITNINDQRSLRLTPSVLAHRHDYEKDVLTIKSLVEGLRLAKQSVSNRRSAFLAEFGPVRSLDRSILLHIFSTLLHATTDSTPIYGAEKPHPLSGESHSLPETWVAQRQLMVLSEVCQTWRKVALDPQNGLVRTSLV